ncbi:hypothetical protein [Mangrovibacillus cuniculi]|uniref:Uncharacterized protein n=1 Tax=Mangrovibacillus cuniculi TaxID=2593652 RepID=A0A7S8C8Q4_9BACI|nr:hypothetical protein [Mangrovibacillus cuniculi]QPC45477.1 hypothetical protein G8O30_03940 [Mangrovibacillus cuniculi]
MYRHYPMHYMRHAQQDQRFIGFGLLPFLAGGLGGFAVGSLLTNRPCCGPYGPYPYPQPYPYPVPTPYPMYQQGQMPGYPTVTENVNIYTGR